MTRSILETTGDFQLIDFETNTLIRFQGPTLVEQADTAFIQARITIGHLKLIGVVNDEATDEELLKYIKESDGNYELAVASFMSAFPVEGSTPLPTPVEKKARKGT